MEKALYWLARAVVDALDGITPGAARGSVGRHWRRAVAAVLLLVRRRTHEEQVPVSAQGKLFPSSVRLAKFEPVAASEALSTVQDVTT